MVNGLSIIEGVFRFICGHVAAPHLERGRAEQKAMGYDALTQSAAERRKEFQERLRAVYRGKERRRRSSSSARYAVWTLRGGIDTHSSFAT